MFIHTHGDPLGGNLSSCSGHAWSAKRSCHLIVSFCTKALYSGLPASKERGRVSWQQDTHTGSHGVGCPAGQTKRFYKGCSIWFIVCVCVCVGPAWSYFTIKVAQIRQQRGHDVITQYTMFMKQKMLIISLCYIICRTNSQHINDVFNNCQCK